MSKVIKRDLPQFLANRIKCDLGSPGYLTLMDLVTLSEHDYVARMLDLTSEVSNDDTDLLAVVGQYVCDDFTDSTVNVVYTEWDELLRETLRVNELMENLENRLMQELSTSKSGDTEDLRDIMRFNLCLEQSKYDHTYTITLRMSTSDGEYNRVFHCAFDTGFASVTCYPKRFWQERLWTRLTDFDNSVVENVENIVDSMESDIESAIFDLLYHLNKVSTKAIPGRVLVEKLPVSKKTKK